MYSTEKTCHHIHSLITAFAVGVMMADSYYIGYQLPVDFDKKINQFSLFIQEKFKKDFEIILISYKEFNELVSFFLKENCIEWNNWTGEKFSFTSLYDVANLTPSFIDLDGAAINATNYLQKDS